MPKISLRAVLGTVGLTLVIAIGEAALGVPIVGFLNENAGVLSAAAAGILAYFSWGTWKLYHLERQKAWGRKGRVAAIINKTSQEFLGASTAIGGALPDNSYQQERMKEGVARRRRWVEARKERISEAFDAAAELPPTVLAYLQIALVKIDDTDRLLDRWENLSTAGPSLNEELQAARNKTKHCLAAIAYALRKAYESIPLQERTWGGDFPEYGQLLERVSKEILEEHPEAALDAPNNMSECQ